MADFLSRLVERTYGLIQVAEPMIIPSFAAASNMEYTESSVFDIKPAHQGVSRPEVLRGITQPVKYPGHNAGIREEGTVANNRAENSTFDVTGTQMISGHEQSGFDLPPGAMSEKVGFGRDMPDVSQQLPEDATRKNEKTVYRPQPEPVIREMTGDDEPGFTEDIHVEHAKNGDKTVYYPQPRPMISETPVKDENSSESRKTEIMVAEKKILYQPERSLNITGTPEDEVSGNLKKAYSENMKTLKDTTGVFQVQPGRMSHEPQTHSANNLQESADKYQRMENGNQSEFQVAASDEIPEMINLTDSAEKKYAKQGHVYHNVTKPGNELKIEDLKPFKPGTLVLGRKETGVDKILAKNEPDLQHENSLPDRKMFQTYHTPESYISTQKRREVQDSLASTAIIGTSASRRNFNQNISALSNRIPPEKRITESHPEIKVTIGRIEVRAATKPAQVSAPSRQNPALSLNDYLKKRNGNTL